MKINIPDWAWSHFWHDTPPDFLEFWAFRFKPPCKVGDELLFHYQGKPVARAVVCMIEAPGLSQCEGTGKFKNRWKVFWTQDSFEDLRKKWTPAMDARARK